jgi:mono/diheme cytochrome c family protein
MKRVVTVVQVAAVLCALAFVVMLFANEPNRAEPARASAGATTGTTVINGADVFANRCSSCHGSDAGGGLGPQLSQGHVVARFPDIADQIKVITNGRGGMPGFKAQLSAEEIRAVAEYERSL